MTNQPPGRLEFTDCLGCGKRVATKAPICRHCNTKRTPAKTVRTSTTTCDSSKDEEDLDDAYSHGALGVGGYGKDDLDETNELRESQATKKGLFWYVALVLLIVFSIGALFPWFW